jgi:hypothetical protein
MGRKPDIALGLCVADHFIQYPDARAWSDDVRMHRELKQAAGIVGGIELA